MTEAQENNIGLVYLSAITALQVAAITCAA